MSPVSRNIRARSTTTSRTMASACPATASSSSSPPAVRRVIKKTVNVSKASGTARPRGTGAKAFARDFPLYNDQAELKPIRRPLPPRSHHPSDDESSEDEYQPLPKRKRRNPNDPFYNPDESDSDMSRGISRSPSPSPRRAGSAPPRSSKARSVSTQASPSTPSNRARSNASSGPSNPPPSSNRALILKAATAPIAGRPSHPLNNHPRGYITPFTDFDTVLHFTSSPLYPPTIKRKKRPVRQHQEEERPEAQFNCVANASTADMSWIRRAGGGSGSGGKVESVADGKGKGKGKAKVVRKRAARRAATAPKRAYRWKDPSTKNKPRGRGA